MAKEKVIPSGRTDNLGASVMFSGKRSVYLYFTTDTTNCKLSFINGIGCISNLSDKDKKEIVDNCLSSGFCKGAVLFNTTQKSVADWLCNNYKTYYYNKVPIGYTNGFQYHILIKNESIGYKNSSCRDPENKIEEPIDHSSSLNILNKNTLKIKLKTLLKKLRRKDDYVDDFINSN